TDRTDGRATDRHLLVHRLGLRLAGASGSDDQACRSRPRCAFCRKHRSAKTTIVRLVAYSQASGNAGDRVGITRRKSSRPGDSRAAHSSVSVCAAAGDAEPVAARAVDPAVGRASAGAADPVDVSAHAAGPRVRGAIEAFAPDLLLR